MKTRFMREFSRGVRESESSKVCPGHGTTMVKGKCPDCVIENDGWSNDQRGGDYLPLTGS
jgi:hypothetical protein